MAAAKRQTISNFNCLNGVHRIWIFIVIHAIKQKLKKKKKTNSDHDRGAFLSRDITVTVTGGLPTHIANM